MGGNKKDYIRFEEKVASMLKLKGYVNVVHNTNIGGKQIDVYGEFPTPRGDLNCIVECKKYKDKVGIKAIEEFAGLMSLLKNIDHGYIISDIGFTDKAKALAKNNEKIILKSFHEFIDTLYDCSNYIKYKIEEWEKSDLSNCYKFGEFGNKEIFPLSQLIEEWLNDDSKNYLSLLGDYGTGKTSFSERYTYELALRYKEDPSNNRIPILIHLKNFRQYKSIENMIISFFNKYGIKFSDYESFQTVYFKNKPRHSLGKKYFSPPYAVA